MPALLRSALIVCATFAILTACASRAPERAAKPSHRVVAEGARVGVYVEISPHPKQFHQGMTAAGKFVKTYPFIWGLEQSVRSTINDALKAQGLVPVDLNEAKINAGYLSRQALSVIREQTGVQAAVFVKNERAYIGLPVHQYADVSGVYSVRGWTGTSFTTVAPLQWNVWSLDGPGEDIAKRPELAKQLNTLRQIRPEMWKGVEVADYEAITEAEFQSVKAIILRSVAQSAEQMARTLVAR